MANETLDDEEEKEIISPETIIEWERIQFPLHHNVSPSPSPDPSNSAASWSTVDDDSRPRIVFPPVNHEGLQIFSNHDVRDIDLDRVVQPSPLHSPRHRTPWGNDTAAAVGWWDVGLELLRFKFARIATSFRNFAAARGLPTSFRSGSYVHAATLGGSIMLLLLYLRFRRRRSLRRESLLDLIRVIKQKDEEILQKINLLLQQIGRMNEIMLASKYGVPIPSLPRTA